jgi:two-component system OmpR family response regulator
MQAKGTPVTRAQLLAAVWGEGETDEGVVTVYLHYLRKKLERHGKKMIYAVRGHGYALREEEEA